MLEFHFRISMTKNSIKFFPVNDDFPFCLEETENGTLKTGIQKSFERLVAEQETIRRWPMNEKRINKLVNDLNGYMFNTGAMWTIVNHDLREGQFFLRKTRICMPNLHSIIYHQNQSMERPRAFVNRSLLNAPNQYNDTKSAWSTTNKKSHLFRPWE